MKSILIILLSISYSSYAKAGFETNYSEIKEVILTLGLDLKDFSIYAITKKKKFRIII